MTMEKADGDMNLFQTNPETEEDAGSMDTVGVRVEAKDVKLQRIKGMYEGRTKQATVGSFERK